MSYRTLATIIQYLCNFIAVLIVLPCHEFAHAYAAVKNGDRTPIYAGRYTLNPFAHFDPLGLAMMILVRFGWAKPVPVNPDNFTNYKKGLIQVSAAGVTANLILAILFCPLAILAENIVFYDNASFPLRYFLYCLPNSFFYLNVGLFIFNLLPFYPLDGFRLYDALTKRRGNLYYFLRRYGTYILLGIIAIGYIGRNAGFPQLDVLSQAINFIAGLIEKLWRLII